MKLTRKLFAIVTVMAVAFSAMAFTASADTLFYDGAADLEAFVDNPGCPYPAYNDVVGEDGAGRLVLAGSPHVFWSEEGRGLGVSNRQNEYSSIDVVLGDMEVGSYRLEVVFNANEEVIFKIKDADGPWESLGTAEGKDDTTVSIEFDITETGKSNAQNRFRLNLDNDDLTAYYIKSVKIYALGGGAASDSGDSTPVASSGDDGVKDPSKDGADTGIADVAAVAGIALVAAAGVIASRKRK